MHNEEVGAPVGNQERIWDHFQNVATEAFAGARPRLDFIIKQIYRKKTIAAPSVLNIGVGDGYFDRAVQNLGWEICSLDPNEESVRRLMDVGVKAYKGYIEEIPFGTGRFDFVVASEVLEHLTNEQRRLGIGEILRVLKRGGWFIGTVPYQEDLLLNQVVCPKCGEVFHRWGHQQSFNKEMLRSAFSDFSPEAVEVRTMAFVPFRGQPLIRQIKSLVYWMRGRLGAPITTTSLYFAARK